MVEVVYKLHDGGERRLDVALGTSIMQAAVNNDVPGIDGDCGGNLACATCHVYVDPAWISRLPPVSEMEASMLEFASDVQENSRLSCQIVVTAELDGVTVGIPANQG